LASSVLIIGNFLSSSFGTRGVCEDLAPRLATAGWTVLTTSDRPGRIARLRDMVGTAWSLRHAYAVAQVDVYSGPAFMWAEAVCMALRLAHKPYVLTLHGGDLSRFAERWPVRVRRLLNSAAAVTTPSRYLLDQMQPYRADLHLIPNALDLRAYQYSFRNHPRPNLIWLRAFASIYNPEMAVHTLNHLKPIFPDIKLTMIGPDKNDGSLQQVIRLTSEFGLQDNLNIIRGVSKKEVPYELNKGDIFLNTTRYESFGVSVMEAAALGLNIVTTDVGELPRMWQDGSNALLVPSNDPLAMAGAVRRILVEPGLAARLSANARAKAEQYDWSVVLPQWERLLAELASEGWS
jgi:glycosyltransferase involved in cell wall biosynthesis